MLETHTNEHLQVLIQVYGVGKTYLACRLLAIRDVSVATITQQYYIIFGCDTTATGAGSSSTMRASILEAQACWSTGTVSGSKCMGRVDVCSRTPPTTSSQRLHQPSILQQALHSIQ